MRAITPRGVRGPGAGRASSRAGRHRWASAGARYEVLDRVGEGTLFVVYRVRDKSNNRVLALKALKGAFNQHPRFAAALSACAERAAQLTHPHLARMDEVGAEEGTLFLATEWLPGQTLEARLRRAPFGRAEALSFMRQIADALNYLHQNGAVHGDLRPRQIGAAADGSLKLTDGGLYEAFAAAGLAPTDVMEDAAYYQAPERADGDAPSPSSDLYSLGVILYRMLTGRVPFDGPSPLSIALRHRRDAPLRPSQFNPGCPPDLEEVALRLLEKDPRARYASAGQLVRDLAVGTSVAARDARPVIAQNGSVPAPAQAAAPPREDEPPVFGATRASGHPPPPAALNGAGAAGAAGAGIAAGVAAAGSIAEAAPVVGAAAAIPAAATTLSGGAAAVRGRPVRDDSRARRAIADDELLDDEPLDDEPFDAEPFDDADDTLGGADDATDDAALLGEREARRRQRRREAIGALLAIFWLLAAVGLLGGIFYGAYYFWKKDTPREVRVPSYIGKDREQARLLLQKSGLKLVVTGEIYDPKQPAGTVVDGQPKAGKIVRTGRQVGVTVSRGAEPTTMPDLTELDLKRALQIIERGGMRVGTTSVLYHDTIPKGYICGQYPEAGQSFLRSDPINLLVSRGPQPTEAPEPAQLPPPPIRAAPEESAAPMPLTAPIEPPEVAMVSRVVHVRVALPTDGPSQEVRVVVRDPDGERTVYQHTHAPGDLVDEDVQVTRPQGTTAEVRIFVDGKLHKKQRI